ncbi:hypothetical protein [Neptuniibacter halophilus]|uniref:hypothetical protein n=1 Tax=Neptuniibacter halophilus TaxID=651666 RepID=UPI00257319BB|nr:hypothetical protein [Neptuniibacter halophilus]
MRQLLPLILLFLPLQGWAQTNEADLSKCREYANAALRSQCVQFYKRTNTRVAFSRCKKDLECWQDRYQEQAKESCRLAFKRRAAGSSLWASYWHSQDFDKARWFDQGAGVLMYYERESNAEIQCIFNPKLPNRVRLRIAARS